MKNKFLNNIKVVFIEPEKSGNIGSMARIMKNFGLNQLILVNPKTEVINGEAKAFAMHGINILEKAVVISDINEVIKKFDLIIGTSAISGGDYNPLRFNLSIKEINKIEIPEKGEIALLFGRESSGLSNDELNFCDFIISIPASLEYPTLNVTQSAAIIFYEFFNLTKEKIFQKGRLAKKEEKELILKFLDETLIKINYPKHKIFLTERIFKNLLGRALITGREAYTLMGIFRRILDHIERREKK